MVVTVVDCSVIPCSGAAAVLGEEVHSAATLSSVSIVDLRQTRPVWAGSAVRIAYRKHTKVIIIINIIP